MMTDEKSTPTRWKTWRDYLKADAPFVVGTLWAIGLAAASWGAAWMMGFVTLVWVFALLIRRLPFYGRRGSVMDWLFVGGGCVLLGFIVMMCVDMDYHSRKDHRFVRVNTSVTSTSDSGSPTPTLSPAPSVKVAPAPAASKASRPEPSGEPREVGSARIGKWTLWVAGMERAQQFEEQYQGSSFGRPLPKRTLKPKEKDDTLLIFHCSVRNGSPEVGKPHNRTSRDITSVVDTSGRSYVPIGYDPPSDLPELGRFPVLPLESETSRRFVLIFSVPEQMRPKTLVMTVITLNYSPPLAEHKEGTFRVDLTPAGATASH